MRYHEIQTTAGRFRLPASHPILTEIDLDPSDWHTFERLVDDSPVTRILGHDMADGRMTIFVACGSEEVRNKLNDGWA